MLAVGTHEVVFERLTVHFLDEKRNQRN